MARTKPYSDAALLKLKSSGITAAQAAHAGIRELTAAQTQALYAGAPHAPALQLPYFDVEGKPTNLYRLRVLAAPTDGFTLTKPRRYYQPPNTLPQVYFPKVAGQNWRAIADDPLLPVIITEGELKALCACVLEFPTLGLGGVWNFRSAKNGVTLIPELRTFKWAQRRTYICYDSDASAKPDVVRAMLALSHELTALGAKVFDATLEELPKLEKTGLDDYLVAKGERALIDNVLHRASLIEENKALHEFNMRYAYIRDMNRVLDLENGTMHDPHKFVYFLCANEKFTVMVAQGQGPTASLKPVVKSTAKEWMEWPHRAEVNNVAFVPGAERMLPSAKWNTWTGWPCVPSKGSVVLWNKLLDHMFVNAEPDMRQWFERWAAYPIQYPGTKLYTAVAVWGASTGTGKTLMGETLMRLYGVHGSLISQSDLEDAYNDWITSKQFILGDEVTGNESRKHADRLKGYITSNYISVRIKYQPLYTLANCANLYFSSNHPDAFFLDPQDRRMFVIEAPKAALPQVFYDEYDAWYRSTEGMAALFHHLLNLPLRDFNPRGRAPQTAAKQRMIEDSRSDLSVWVDRLVHAPEEVIPKINGHAPREMFSSEELRAFYDPDGSKRISINALGKELKRQGAQYVAQGNPLRVQGLTRARYFAVLNADKWVRAAAGAARAHLEQHKFGKEKDKF